MITYNKRIRGIMLASVAGFALTACGGSSTPVVDPPVDPPKYVVTTGTISGTTSSNGLGFADGDGIVLGDLLDKKVTLRAARLDVTGDLADIKTASSQLIDLEITSIESSGGGEWVLTVDMGGDTLLLYYDESDPGTPCGIASNGITYCADMFQVGDFVAVVVLEGEGGVPTNWEESVVGAFAGLETDPDYLAFKGSASYTGGFYVEGVSTDLDIYDDTGGIITIDANFASGDIEGNLDGGLDFDVDFEGEIAGNGWTAKDTETSTFADGDLEKTAGEIQLDGVFYGPTAQETAGTILVDIELTDDLDNTGDVVGIGGFIAYEDDVVLP